MSVDPKLDQHQIAYFFKQENLQRPEFQRVNHKITLKDAEKEFLVEQLLKEEEEAKKRQEEEEKTKQQPVAAAGAGAKGKEPKKDAKAPPKKGAVAEDKNAPKQIVVECPEVSKLENLVIVEKDFKTGQQAHDRPPEQLKKGQELTAEETTLRKKALRK